MMVYLAITIGLDVAGLEVAWPDCMFKSDIPDGPTVDGLGIDNKLAMIVRVSMVALSWFLHNNKI